MSVEIKYHRDFRGQPLRPILWNTEEPNDEARFAMDLVRTYGLVAGKTDGREDSAGRTVMHNMPVQEVVQRAFDLAGETFRVIRDRGLLISLLPYEDALDRAREEADRN